MTFSSARPMIRLSTIVVTLLSLAAAVTASDLYPSHNASGNGTTLVEVDAILASAPLGEWESKTVKFGGFYSLQNYYYLPSKVQWSDWTWNVTVGDLFWPNSSTTEPSQYVTHTTYKLNWPSSADNVKEAVRAKQEGNATSDPLSCFALFDFNFTLRASQDWQNLGTSDHSSCEPLISAGCLSEIARAFAGGGCRQGAGNLDWGNSFYREDICGTSLSVNLESDVRNSQPPQIYNLTDPAAGSNATLMRGENFYYSLSEPYTAENSSTYVNEYARVRVMGVLTPQGPTIMCNRAALGPSVWAGATNLNGARSAALALVVASAVALMYW